jgi:6-hydroxycyclohex-1-ene-1-carbonyl-CoA dehydrogenase
MTVVTRTGWRMTGPGRLERFDDRLEEPPPGWTTLEVVGCGVCHTDLGYLYGGVATAHRGPIVLGHEIVGRTLDGELVLVPAVSPCGECAACKRGRPTACASSKMPGNHHDGGFASHVQVPARWLCPAPEIADAWQLAAIADAVTTPLQAMRRTGLAAGDVAIIIGVGGVGGFLVQLAAALGAVVVAIDVVAERVARALAGGATIGMVAAELEAKTARKQLAHRLGALASIDGWHVFECSGSPAGQTLAWSLLTRGGRLAVIGFTPETVPLRLSTLMALDAEAYGNWGADPALYPEAMRLVFEGRLDLAGSVERHSLDDVPAVLAAAHRGELSRRPIVVPHA